MSFNQATIIGNLGGDVDQRFTQGGTAVAKFSVATTESKKDRDGNKTEVTTWHRVVAFGTLAEICGRYLAKGSKVFIQGRIRNEKYTDSAGIEKHSSEIVADTMKMLDKRTAASETETQRQELRGNNPPRDTLGRDQTPDFVDDDINF